MRLLTIAILILASLGGGPVHAQAALKAPAGETILEITGQITVKNAPGGAVFDRAMLEALGSEAITTKTPWFAGTVQFEGVPMKRLLEAVGANGKSIRVTALNDYVITIPVEDFARHPAILALKRDGRYMAVRDKGPLFLVYPYDSNPELQSQLYYARSAWQVKRFDVLP